MDIVNIIHITSEQCRTVEEMSADLMTPRDIAIIIGIDPAVFLHYLKHKPTSDLALAYERGRIATKQRLHKMVIHLASMGSPQAELLADKYLKEQNNG